MLCPTLLFFILLHSALRPSLLCFILRCYGDTSPVSELSSTLLFPSFLSFYFLVLQNVKIATVFCFVALILLLDSSLHAKVHAVVWAWGCVSDKRYPQTHTNISCCNQSTPYYLWTALDCTVTISYHAVSYHIVSYRD